MLQTYAQQSIQKVSKEEEIEMYEQYRSVFAIVKKVEELIADIDYLENQPWAKN